MVLVLLAFSLLCICFHSLYLFDCNFCVCRIFAVSLAADLVSSISNGISKEFGNSRSNVSSSIDNMDLLDIVKCLFPRPFSRSMFNKGLHHANSFVKHGTLRLLLELLKLLDSLFDGLNHNSSSGNPLMQHMVSVKQEIQNYVQPYLPDLQVLLNLLSSLDTCYESNNSSLKRNASHREHDGNSRKKLKMDTSESDIDIIVGGISSAPDIDLSGNRGTVDDALKEDAPDDAEDLKNNIGEIWGLELHSIGISTLKDAESYLLSKLLDALRYYHVCSVLFGIEINKRRLMINIFVIFGGLNVVCQIKFKMKSTLLCVMQFLHLHLS